MTANVLRQIQSSLDRRNRLPLIPLPGGTRARIDGMRNRSEALFVRNLFLSLLHGVLGRLLGTLLPGVLERRGRRVGVLEETAGS